MACRPDGRACRRRRDAGRRSGTAAVYRQSGAVARAAGGGGTARGWLADQEPGSRPAAGSRRDGHRQRRVRRGRPRGMVGPDTSGARGTPARRSAPRCAARRPCPVPVPASPSRIRSHVSTPCRDSVRRYGQASRPAAGMSLAGHLDRTGDSASGRPRSLPGQCGVIVGIACWPISMEWFGSRDALVAHLPGIAAAARLDASLLHGQESATASEPVPGRRGPAVRRGHRGDPPDAPCSSRGRGDRAQWPGPVDLHPGHRDRRRPDRPPQRAQPPPSAGASSSMNSGGPSRSCWCRIPVSPGQMLR